MLRFYWGRDLSWLAFALNKFNAGNLRFYGLSIKQVWIGFISWEK